jgi:hypothetical protein
MTFDRPYDEAGDALPEPHQRHGRAGAEAGAVRTELAEPRTRAECYEALRAADDGSAGDGENRRPAETGSH